MSDCHIHSEESFLDVPYICITRSEFVFLSISLGSSDKLNQWHEDRKDGV